MQQQQTEASPQPASSHPKIQGKCDPRFNKLSTLLAQFIASDAELGASIAVTLDGVPVVDIWGGHSDHQRTKAWEHDTIACAFSCSKTITALATLLLIDRGLVSVDDPVSKHWPAFAANGKENVLIRHLLSHTSGLPGWDEPITPDDLQDVASCTEKLARQKPWWNPGEASGYHALSYGHLLGEVVRRVSGKSLTEFIRDELALPLNADFQLGAVESDWGRIAPVEMSTSEPKPDQQLPAPDSIPARVMTNPPIAKTALEVNGPVMRRAEVGAANGHTNARALARLLSVFANGGTVGGKQILRPETVELVLKEQVRGTDLVISKPMTFGLGFGLTGEGSLVEWLPAGRIGFWGGFGGSLVVFDAERKMSMSYVMNRLSMSSLGSERTMAYAKALYEALGAEVDTDGSVRSDAVA